MLKTLASESKSFGFVSNPYFKQVGQSPEAFICDLASDETLFKFDLGKLILETGGLKNDVTTELIEDPRQPYFTLEEITDNFRLIVDIESYPNQVKPGLPYTTSVFVTIKHDSKTETRQIDLTVVLKPKLK